MYTARRTDKRGRGAFHFNTVPRWRNGRRGGLKIRYLLEVCGFDPLPRHHSLGSLLRPPQIGAIFSAFGTILAQTNDRVTTGNVASTLRHSGSAPGANSPTDWRLVQPSANLSRCTSAIPYTDVCVITLGATLRESQRPSPGSPWSWPSRTITLPRSRVIIGYPSHWKPSQME